MLYISTSRYVIFIQESWSFTHHAPSHKQLSWLRNFFQPLSPLKCLLLKSSHFFQLLFFTSQNDQTHNKWLPWAVLLLDASKRLSIYFWTWKQDKCHIYYLRPATFQMAIHIICYAWFHLGYSNCFFPWDNNHCFVLVLRKWPFPVIVFT